MFLLCYGGQEACSVQLAYSELKVSARTKLKQLYPQYKEK